MPRSSFHTVLLLNGYSPLRSLWPSKEEFPDNKDSGISSFSGPQPRPRPDWGVGVGGGRVFIKLRHPKHTPTNATLQQTGKHLHGSRLF